MPKKNREPKQFNELEKESASADTETTPSVPAETAGESTPSGMNSQETAEKTPEEQISAGTENESSSDALLDDVRRSLLEEEETEKSKEEKKWWRRIGRKEKSTEQEPSPTIVEMDLPATSVQNDMVDFQEQGSEPEQYEAEINDLIDMLEAESTKSDAESSSVAVEAEIPVEPEPEFDLEQLKEQAFRQLSQPE